MECLQSSSCKPESVLLSTSCCILSGLLTYPCCMRLLTLFRQMNAFMLTGPARTQLYRSLSNDLITSCQIRHTLLSCPKPADDLCIWAERASQVAAASRRPLKMRYSCSFKLLMFCGHRQGQKVLHARRQRRRRQDLLRSFSGSFPGAAGAPHPGCVHRPCALPLRLPGPCELPACRFPAS